MKEKKLAFAIIAIKSRGIGNVVSKLRRNKGDKKRVVVPTIKFPPPKKKRAKKV